MTTPWIIRPASLTSPATGPLRTPPRPAELQEQGYGDSYDSSTIFYDVFRVGRRVLAVGPPAGSLAEHVNQLQLVSSGQPLGRFHAESGLDRLGRFWTRPVRKASGTLEVRSRGSAAVVVGDDLTSRFRHRRVVMTMSKDNNLEWIKDWGNWYVRRHKADAILLYDNGSTTYSLTKLWDVLARIRGVEVAAVVDWPFKYGPVGRPPGFFWDSNYAQHGALEHARWRFLRSANGFLNVDIDELANDPSGESVFSAGGSSASGAVHLPGKWVYLDPTAPRERLLRHRDSYWVRSDPPDRPGAPKWCVVPARLPRSVQLTVHKVVGVPMEFRDGFFFWHFHAISTNWDGNRAQVDASGAGFKLDEELRGRHCGAMFPEAPPLRRRPTIGAVLEYLPTRFRLSIPESVRRLARRFVVGGLGRRSR